MCPDFTNSRRTTVCRTFFPLSLAILPISSINIFFLFKVAYWIWRKPKYQPLLHTFSSRSWFFMHLGCDSISYEIKLTPFSLFHNVTFRFRLYIFSCFLYHGALLCLFGITIMASIICIRTLCKLLYVCLLCTLKWSYGLISKTYSVLNVSMTSTRW